MTTRPAGPPETPTPSRACPPTRCRCAARPSGAHYTCVQAGRTGRRRRQFRCGRAGSARRHIRAYIPDRPCLCRSMRPSAATLQDMAHGLRAGSRSWCLHSTPSTVPRREARFTVPAEELQEQVPEQNLAGPPSPRRSRRCSSRCSRRRRVTRVRPSVVDRAPSPVPAPSPDRCPPRPAPAHGPHPGRRRRSPRCAGCSAAASPPATARPSTRVRTVGGGASLPGPSTDTGDRVCAVRVRRGGSDAAGRRSYDRWPGAGPEKP